jgi:predicted enzyme related to lactoylglutathione lyase
VAFILAQCLLTGCAVTNKTSHRELTPVAEPPTGIHHQGKFVWNDLLTDDVAAAKDFYGQLFGWNFDELSGYTAIKNEERRIGGMVQVDEDAETAGAARWLCALSVEDVDAAVAVFIEEGGLVHEGPVDMLNRGRGALVSDPQGAQLIVMRSTGGDPEDVEPAMSSWLWHELWSNKTEASLAFYQKLAGYDFFGEPDDYIVLENDQWRAGIRYSTDSDLEMRWVPAVRVADTEAISARVKELGGKVTVEPMATSDGGSVGLLSDPSGALLIFQSWSASTSEEEK